MAGGEIQGPDIEVLEAAQGGATSKHSQQEEGGPNESTQ